MIESVGYKHQLRIARDTLRMNPAMVGVMGGMTIEEARAFLDKHNLAKQSICQCPEDEAGTYYTSRGVQRCNTCNKPL